jgi:hypothetical protein
MKCRYVRICLRKEFPRKGKREKRRGTSSASSQSDLNPLKTREQNSTSGILIRCDSNRAPSSLQDTPVDKPVESLFESHCPRDTNRRFDTLRSATGLLTTSASSAERRAPSAERYSRRVQIRRTRVITRAETHIRDSQRVV